MKHNAATDETREQAALYALGALSQIEARAFEVHIREGCSICESDLRAFDGVVGALGLHPVQASPPVYLRDLLVARIEKETATAAKLAEGFVAQPRQPETTSRPARSGAARVIIPWAIAASLALATLGSLYAWRRAEEQASSQEAQIAAFMVERNRLEHRLDDESKTGSENAAMLRALQSPGARMIHMAAQQSIAADGELVWDTDGAECVVSATLPPAPAGKVYQLWFVLPTAPKSAGLLETDATGHIFRIVSLPRGLGPVKAAAVTLEPEGGSDKPTMPIYVMGKTS